MSLDNPAIASRIRSRGLGHWLRERDYAMRLLFLTLFLGLIAVTRTAAAPQQPISTHVTQEVAQLQVDVEGLQTTPDGLYVLVTLASHNPTATPHTIGLHQWANAHTQLGDNMHQRYTLVQTFGIGYGYDRHDWLALDAHSHATAAFLFRIEDPRDRKATSYTFISEQQIVGDDPHRLIPFAIALDHLTPHP